MIDLLAVAVLVGGVLTLLAEHVYQFNPRRQQIQGVASVAIILSTVLLLARSAVH